MSKEIIALDAEEVPIEKVVEQSFLTQLEKMEITKQVLVDKKEDCLKLQLNGQDKEAYTLIRETRLNMKATRVAIEKVCKKGREDATKTQKAWLAMEKDFVKIVSEGEDYLEKLEEEFEAEQERIKAEVKRKQEEAFILRQADLTKMGATYADGSFVLGDVSYEAVLIKESDDETWETMKAKFTEQYQKNEETRLAEEKKKQEAEAELNRQREEQEKKQRELEEREANIKKKEQEEFERQQFMEKQKIEESQKRQSERNSSRINQLQSLGMYFKFDDNAYSAYDVFAATLEIITFTDEEWSALIEKITPVIAQRKKEAEDKRLADIEEQKRIAAEEATKKEKERAAEEKKQEEAKKKLEEEKKVKEMEMADDKTKWNNWLDAVKNIPPVPTMKSPAYRTKAAAAREKIIEITGI